MFHALYNDDTMRHRKVALVREIISATKPFFCPVN